MFVRLNVEVTGDPSRPADRETGKPETDEIVVNADNVLSVRASRRGSIVRFQTPNPNEMPLFVTESPATVIAKLGGAA